MSYMCKYHGIDLNRFKLHTLQDNLFYIYII